MTIDTIDSITGGALGTTQGSCLPRTFRSVSKQVEMSIVLCVLAIEAAGLKPTLNIIGIPFDNPPRIPPALLVLVTILPSTIVYKSLFSDPFLLHPLKPEPNSTALTAGILNSAL